MSHFSFIPLTEAHVDPGLLLTLLTNVMVQDLFEKLLFIQLIKESPALCNSKVHCRFHKIPLLDTSLSHVN
jgi:hypothetical protein